MRRNELLWLPPSSAFYIDIDPALIWAPCRMARHDVSQLNKIIFLQMLQFNRFKMWLLCEDQVKSDSHAVKNLKHRPVAAWNAFVSMKVLFLLIFLNIHISVVTCPECRSNGRSPSKRRVVKGAVCRLGYNREVAILICKINAKYPQTLPQMKI